jgi:Pyruvate:ferredoxin oxidoreductase and related 2-oxoacid:ferredoxin oxidoreductases, beta subunit
MAKVFEKTKMLTDVPFHYCPGCGHGIAHRLVAEVLEEIGAKGHCVGVAPVGCAVFAYNYFNCDMQEASHGRAPAVATGIKRVNPDNIVFSYQGDGDLASIGMAETVHAATRGEKITIIFINNAIYGMTGGQMAPTTLVGQKATTCVYGRDPAVNGNPIKTVRVTIHAHRPDLYSQGNRLLTSSISLRRKRQLKTAFEHQIEGKGFSFVELLSACPTNWHMTPEQAVGYVREDMEKLYPLGVYKEV